MSLRVWLPLTKDLRNQGLDNVTIANNGATFDTNGKLGGCYSFNGSNNKIEISNAPNPNNISIAMWFKRNANTNTRQFLYTQWNGITVELQADGKLACSIDTADGQTGYCRSTIAITTSSGWNHVAYTYKEGVGTNLYLNGTLIASAIVTKPIRWSTIVGNIGYYNTYFNGLMNDFRIYDHTLSPLEVKQISQGLILHYPLNRNGWGQENLLPNSKLDGSWEYPSTNFKDQYAPITASVPTGSVYTLSFDAKSTVNGDKIRTHYYSPNTTTTCTSSQGTIKTASDGNMDFTLSTQWKRYWVVYNQNETSAVKHIICPRMVSGQGTGVVSVKNVKLEEGSIATPWCPNSSDALAIVMGLNDNVEYDASGYGNNGTKVGTIYSSDTPKYNVSTVFDENADTITVGPCYSVGQTIDTMSCAIWFKTNTLNSTSPNLVSLGENSFFRFRLTSATSVWYYMRVGTTMKGKTFSCKNLTNNSWHHIAIIFDKGYVYSYIDGELVDTENWTSVGTYLTCELADDYWHLAGFRVSTESFKGNESDFRLYATALSADDVKSLYNNSAYIDNQGNIYGAVYEEV